MGILSADSAGRSRMADGFVTAAKLDASQDWTGKTISGSPSVSLSGAVTLTGAVNLSGSTLTMPAGAVVQVVAASTVTYSSLTSGGAGTGDFAGATSGSIPVDNTIPQSTEGAQLFTAAITPKSATNILEFEIIIPCYNASNPALIVAALFQDATANALAAQVMNLGDSIDQNAIVLTHRMVAGTTSSTTFKVRLGTSAGTVYVNGNSSARLFGGIMAARLTIKEITA